MTKIILAVFVILIWVSAGYIAINKFTSKNGSSHSINLEQSSPSTSPTFQPTISIPLSHIIPQRLHTFQTFNNCGPAAMSMALSYNGYNIGQQEIGNKLRPYQNPQGDNDDKSVTLEEIAKEAQTYNLIPFHRPNGDIEKLKKFIANDIPVVARTLLVLDDDIGHYRVIRGYNDNLEQLTQDDSLQSANSTYSYGDFLALWKPYNYEYLVMVPKEKEEIAVQILGEELSIETAWQNALQNLERQIAQNPNDTFVQFNLANTLYHLGRYQESTEAFEKVEGRLSFRTLWYQIEPILAYRQVGNYGRVFQITDQVLNNHNRAFSELYIIRGDIYLEQGNKEAAQLEYEKAVFYNQNLQEAQEKLKDAS